MILRKTRKSQENLLEFEKFLIKWLIDKYGENCEVSSKVIYEKLTNNIYQEQPGDIFIEWEALVLMSFPLEKYYKRTNTKRYKYFLLIFLGIMLLEPTGIIGILTIYYGIGNLLYATPQIVLNQDGIEEKDMWLDLKRYLLDFSYIQDKSVKMVEIWNFYLTYAIIFDIANISEKEIEEFIGENIYVKFENVQQNEEELKIIESKNKKISKDEIKNKIDNELKKYNLKS